jgi:hypothetical protein
MLNSRAQEASLREAYKNEADHDKQIMMNKNMSFFKLILVSIFSLVVQGCGSDVVPSRAQQLRIESGDYGLVDKAEIVSIDLVKFGETFARYDNLASLAARAFLNSPARDIDEFIKDFYEASSRVLVDAVETEIRSRRCLYVVKPNGSIIPEIITNEVEYSSVSIEDDLSRLASEEELLFLYDLDGKEYSVEYDRLIDKYSRDDATISGSIETFAVASQCLINLHVGDIVTLVKFENLIAISPANSDSSFVNF